MNQPTNEQQSLYCRVKGRVQGVGFRYFVLEWAQRLGLSGYVRNCSDGTVELQAYGPRSALESLEAAARRGPYGARVESCQSTWSAAPNDTARRQGFAIRH